VFQAENRITIKKQSGSTQILYNKDKLFISQLVFNYYAKNITTFMSMS